MKNYFERIKNAVNKYVDELEKARKAYNTAMVDIKANYIGNVFVEKASDAKEAFVALVTPWEQNAVNEIEKVFDEINAEIRDIATRICPSDVLANIDVLKRVTTLTQEEARLYFEKFKMYYTARKILDDVLLEKFGVDYANKIDPLNISVDELFDELQGLKKEAIHTVRSISNTGEGEREWYRIANFLSFKQMDRVEGLLASFLDAYAA